MRKNRHVTAGQLAKKASEDKTKYDALEVGYAMCENDEKHFRDCIELHRDKIDQDQFCLVMLLCDDPLIANMKRRKFYAWPFLPKPRPNQTVLLYDKRLDRIIKQLWVLPCAMVMAELAGTNVIVHKNYQRMQAWSVAFYKGTFWDYIRWEHNISMLSEHEALLAHRQKLIQSGAQLTQMTSSEPFDFSKIQINNIVDTKEPLGIQNSDNIAVQV